MNKLSLIITSLLLTGCSCLNASCSIDSFEKCAEAGNPVMESYPEQCRSADGTLYIRDIGNEMEKMDLIRIAEPRPGQEVSETITITGEAVGFWFFEGDFPIVLEDENGNVLGTSYVTAQDEWMTEDFVPFIGTLEADFGKAKKGTLKLKKSNASGLPEHDDELQVPVRFVTN